MKIYNVCLNGVYLLIVLGLLNGCAVNNNIKDERGLFCSSSGYVLKIDSNNIFEIEHIFLNVGIGHYYCKGKWSYISKKRIVFECDTITEWDMKTYPLSSLVWNPYNDKEYIKVVSKYKVIFFQEGYKKTILKSDWYNSIPEIVRERSVILNSLQITP